MALVEMDFINGGGGSLPTEPLNFANFNTTINTYTNTNIKDEDIKYLSWGANIWAIFENGQIKYKYENSRYHIQVNSSGYIEIKLDDDWTGGILVCWT